MTNKLYPKPPDLYSGPRQTFMMKILVKIVNGLRFHYRCFRSSQRRCSIKKVLLKISQNSLENTCARVSFLIKNTFFTEHLRTTASDVWQDHKYTSNL